MRWLRALRERRRSGAPDADSTDDLREFVYMDDVSVYSLLASRVGTVVSELTETEATSLQEDSRTSAAANVGVGKVEGSLSSTRERSRGTQVLRKALVQTAFKQLYDETSDEFVLGGPVPADATVHDVLADLADDDGDGRVVDVDELGRGHLVELEVALEAEAVFKASTIISEVVTILGENPGGFGPVPGLDDARMAQRLVDRLLTGLVPVRGIATNYCVVERARRTFVVHREILEQTRVQADSTCPLAVVGVAEESLFWKDVRRLLFSDHRYRVMARIARDGLNDSWTPVKLVDLLKDVAPDFADAVELLNHGVLPAMTAAASRAPSDGTDRIRRVASVYGALLVDQVGIELTPDRMERAIARQADGQTTRPSIPEWREILKPITALVEDASGRPVPRDVAATARLAALAEAGLTPVSSSADDLTVAADTSESNGWFLDTELVAVYW